MSEREAAIQAMLAGPGYMDCPAAAGARIRVADCVRRQTEGIRFEHQPRWVPYECRDCEAGRKAMERHQQGGGEDMEPNENGVFVCIEPGCSNLATINAKTGKPANGRCGECQSRIMRQARGKKAGEVAACLVPGCEGKAQCRGLCNYHYAAWRRGAIDELLGPWFQGPGQPIVLEAVEPEAEAEPEYAVRCRDCGHEASGTHEEVARHFQPNNLAVKGFDSVCRKCKAAKIKKGWHLAKRVRSEEAQVQENRSQGRVVVDLAGHKAVYDALEAMARREFRSVEQQADWVLKDALEAEGYLDRESGAV